MFKRFLKILLPLVILAGAILAAKSLIESRPTAAVRPPNVVVPLVSVMRVQPQDIQLKVFSQGTVSPRTQSALVAEVSGKILYVSENLAEGAFFEDGEELVRFDTRDFDLAIVQAKAEVARSENRLEIELAEAAVARQEWESLGSGEAPSLVLRKPQLAEAQAALESAHALLDQAELNLERAAVSAPYAGRIREKNVDLGEYVTRGSPIAQIYAVDYVEVRLPLSNDQLAFVDLPLSYRGEQERPGPRVRLTTQFGRAQYHWWGEIVRTDGEIDPKTRMIQAIVQIDDPYSKGGSSGRPPLAVGSFVTAEIFGRMQRGVVLLPRAALRGGDRVLIVDHDNRLRFHDIEILRIQDDTVIVGSGLEPGTLVCTSSLETPVEGMLVRLPDSEEKR